MAEVSAGERRTGAAVSVEPVAIVAVMVAGAVMASGLSRGRTERSAIRPRSAGWRGERRRGAGEPRGDGELRSAQTGRRRLPEGRDRRRDRGGWARRGRRRGGPGRAPRGGWAPAARRAPSPGRTARGARAGGPGGA